MSTPRSLQLRRRQPMIREPWSTAVAAIGAIVLGLSATVITWHRLGPVTRGTMWAEDGKRFIADRLHFGPVDALFRPYGGYQQLVPRLIADAVVQTQPIERWAVSMAAASCLVLGAVVALVFILARPVVPFWPIRALLALVPAIVPLGPVEIQGNTANLHWFLLLLAPWVFQARVRTWVASGLLAVTAFVILCSEIQALMFVPLFALGPRRRTTIPVVGTTVAGAVIEIVSTLTSQRDAVGGKRPGLLDMAQGWLFQTVGSAWTNDLGRLARHVAAHGWRDLYLIGICVLLLAAGGAVLGRGARRWMIVALIVGSGVIWAAAVLVNPAPRLFFWHVPGATLVAQNSATIRYGAASSMFVVAGLVVAASVFLDALRRGWEARSLETRGRALRLTGSVASGLLGLAVAIGVIWTGVTNAHVAQTRRSSGPVWSTQVQEKLRECVAEDSPEQPIAIQGDPATPDWMLHVTCRSLRLLN